MKKLLRRQNQFGPIEKAESELLNDQEPGKGCNKFVINAFNYDRAKAAWALFGAEITEKWLKEKPNTRPHCFYIFECEKKLPFELRPDVPQLWAAYPKNIPSVAKQKKFLDSLI